MSAAGGIVGAAVGTWLGVGTGVGLAVAVAVAAGDVLSVGAAVAVAVAVVETVRVGSSVGGSADVHAASATVRSAAPMGRFISVTSLGDVKPSTIGK